MSMDPGFFISASYRYPLAPPKNSLNRPEKVFVAHVGLFGGPFGRRRRRLDGISARQFNSAYHFDPGSLGEAFGRSVLEDVHGGHPARGDPFGGCVFQGKAIGVCPIVPR